MAAQYHQPERYTSPAQSSPYDALSTGMSSMSLSRGPTPAASGPPTPYGQEQSQYPAPTGSYHQLAQGQSHGAPSSAAYSVAYPSSPAPQTPGSGYSTSQYAESTAYQPSSQSPAGKQYPFSNPSDYSHSSTPASIQSQYSTPAPATSYGYPTQASSQATAYAAGPPNPYQQAAVIGQPATFSPPGSAPSQYQYPYQQPPTPQSAQPTPNGYQAPSAQPPSAPNTADTRLTYSAPAHYQQYPQQQPAHVAAPASGTRDAAQPRYQYPQQGN
jgi:hypothetical protein